MKERLHIIGDNKAQVKRRTHADKKGGRATGKNESTRKSQRYFVTKCKGKRGSETKRSGKDNLAYDKGA
jgi:hypothetical protein